MNNSIFNKVHVRQWICRCANHHHTQPAGANQDGFNTERAMRLMMKNRFTRVDDELVDQLEQSCKQLIDTHVKQSEQHGRTVT